MTSRNPKWRRVDNLGNNTIQPIEQLNTIYTSKN